MKFNRPAVFVGFLLLVACAAYWFGTAAPPSPGHAASTTTPFNIRSGDDKVTLLRRGRSARVPLELAVPPQVSSVPELPGSQMLRDVITAIEGVHSETSALKRSELLEQEANRIAAADLPAVLAMLWTKDLSPDGMALRLRLAQRWAEAAPRDAADFVIRQPPSAARQETLGRIAAVWAGSDFEAASAWARRLPDASDQLDGMVTIAYETARTAPVHAVKLAVDLPAGDRRDDLLAHAASQWAAVEPRLAADWVNQIEERDLRERLLVNVVTAWSDLDAVEAAEFALKSLSPGPQQDSVIVGVVQRWTQHEPAQAAEWVANFPEGALRDTAVENLILLWTDRSFANAGTWLNQLPAGSVRDVGIGALASKVLPLAPEVAAEWAAQISGLESRQREMENIAEAWLSIDPATARAWIAKTSMPKATKERLLADKTE